MTNKAGPFGGAHISAKSHSALGPSKDQVPPFLQPGPGTPHTPQQADHFQQGVKKALQHIQEGHVYQVNLSWEVQGLKVENALHCYLHLRESNPQHGEPIFGPAIGSFSAIPLNCSFKRKGLRTA